jgi:hypothetical protein
MAIQSADPHGLEHGGRTGTGQGHDVTGAAKDAMDKSDRDRAHKAGRGAAGDRKWGQSRFPANAVPLDAVSTR